MKKTIVLASIATLLSSVAMANETIKAVNNKAAISITSGTSFDYSKTHSDGLVTGEYDGSQNGVTLAASTQRDMFGISDVYIAADFTKLSGDTQYNGYSDDLVTGEVFPASFKTDHKSLDFILKIGKGFAVSPVAQITPYLTVGTRKWDRDQRAVDSYYEKHSNSFWGLGAMFQYAVNDKLVLNAEGSYSWNNSTKLLWVDGDTTYNLKNKDTTKLGFGATYRVTKNVSVFADYAWTQTKAGTSEMIYYFIEPASTVKTQRVNVGVAYNF